MKLNKIQLEKHVIISIGCILIAIVFIFLIFSPNLSKIKELRTNISEEKEKLSKAESDVSSLPRIKSEINRLNEEIKQYEGTIPQDTPDWLLEKLNILVNETGINLDKLEPKGRISQLGRYWLYGLDLELRTDYHRLGVFINKLENTSPFLKILDIHILGDREDINKHIVRLTVGAYVQEQK